MISFWSSYIPIRPLLRIRGSTQPIWEFLNIEVPLGPEGYVQIKGKLGAPFFQDSMRITLLPQQILNCLYLPWHEAGAASSAQAVKSTCLLSIEEPNHTDIGIMPDFGLLQWIE